ncbi:hypothetical protein [Streptomyces sp. NPDC006997]
MGREAALAARFAQAPRLLTLGNLPGARRAALFAARRAEFRTR